MKNNNHKCQLRNAVGYFHWTKLFASWKPPARHLRVESKSWETLSDCKSQLSATCTHSLIEPRMWKFMLRNSGRVQSTKAGPEKDDRDPCSKHNSDLSRLRLRRSAHNQSHNLSSSNPDHGKIVTTRSLNIPGRFEAREGPCSCKNSSIGRVGPRVFPLQKDYKNNAPNDGYLIRDDNQSTRRSFWLR
jgi:hypothetical protein